MSNSFLMMKFINSRSEDKVDEVFSYELKEHDDDYGFNGEHYIVKCRVGENEKTCLVNVAEYKRYVNSHSSVFWV